jgi:ribosomal-protein-alanine N-acetyltransferase
MELDKRIISEHLILRLLVPEDKETLFELYSNEESSRLDDWIPMKDSIEAKNMINESHRKFDSKSEIRYGIEEVSSGKLVGSCGIFAIDEWNRKCMVYYQIHHNEWNKGYASGAVKMLIDYIFNKLNCNRIEAYITPGNVGSIKALEKNGFVNEGLHREMEYYKGQFWDGIIMAMLKSDFDQL